MTYAGDNQLWRTSRDRVLLYVRALDLPPFEAVDLAIRCLKETGPSCPAVAMDSLRSTLRDNGIDPVRLSSHGGVDATPKLARSVMVAEEMDRAPWKTGLIRFLKRWKNDLLGRG